MAPDLSGRFGTSIELQGKELFVSSQDGLYIFERIAECVWLQSEHLLVPQIADFDVAGSEVAITSCEPTHGVTVFRRSVTGMWAESATIPLPLDTLCFVAVSLEHDLLLVKGSSVPGSGVDDRVFVYARRGGVWVPDGILEADDQVDFGRNLQLWRGSAFVSDQRNAPKGSTPDTGVVFVYDRNRPGEWTLTSELAPRGGIRFEDFGGSLLVNEDGLFIGAYSRDFRLAGTAGAVYHYRRIHPQGSWRPLRRIFAFDAQISANFGWSLAGNGGTLIVGSPYADAQGAAYCIDVDG